MVGYFKYDGAGHITYVAWPCLMEPVHVSATWLVPIPEAWQAACNDDDSLYDLEVCNV